MRLAITNNTIKLKYYYKLLQANFGQGKTLCLTPIIYTQDS